MKQRLVLSIATTSDSQGRATFRLQVTELGFVYEGSVQVPNAPAGALFAGKVLNTAWGQWAGPTNFGPVQTWGGESFVATAEGLTPSTSYTMTFTGVWMSEEEAEPIPPAAPISTVSVETATLILSARAFTAPGQQSTIRPPTLTRRLTIIAHGGASYVSPAFISITGDQTGASYATSYPFIGSAPDPVRYVAIEPAVDQTYTVQFQGAGSITISIVASFTNPLIEAERGIPVTQDVNNLNPIIVSRSWEPFTLSFTAGLGVANNQQIIAAPAAGKSIYLLTLNIHEQAAAAGAVGRATFHPTGGGIFCGLIIVGPASKEIAFPNGGWELPAATALQVDIATNGMSVTGTYSVAQSRAIIF